MFNIFKKSDKNDDRQTNNFHTNSNDTNEDYSFKSESPSSFINPPSPTVFLQNFQFKSFPSFDYIRKKEASVKSKMLRFLKVSKDLKTKINLLEEIYDVPEYMVAKTRNKRIQCTIDLEASSKKLARILSKTSFDNGSLFDRTVHPVYSNEDHDYDQPMDSSGLFKVPSTPTLLQDSSNDGSIDLPSSLVMYTNDPEVEESNSLFLEHDGNTYIRVDNVNYHLVQSISENGVVITETGLQIIVPEGSSIPMNNAILEQNPLSDPLSSPQDAFIQQQNYLSNANVFPMENKNNYLNTQKNDISPYFGQLYYKNPNEAKVYSDYVALPMRPIPHTPFTLSSQLYTPELSISLTEQESELMLNIDSSKKLQPQQNPIYYQIYSYKEEDRYAKVSSDVWSLVGEISYCPLPMFCNISIPSGLHKYFFAIRSVDEFGRFSDWSNVVQVEVENQEKYGQKSSSTTSR